MTASTPLPTLSDAIIIVRQVLGIGVLSIARFPTGLCHYVYDVITDDGRGVVVRLASPSTRAALTGGIYWHPRLRAAGVPLPALLHAGTDPSGAFAYMLLSRLPGCDLSLAYADLTPQHTRALAAEIVSIQRRIGAMPAASGFGFARSYDDPCLLATWLDVVLADLQRSEDRMRSSGLVDAKHVVRVRERVRAIAPYLLAVQPTPFLDDITTKYVLIHDGALSGIVDTDAVCFGDPLFTLALTTMALLAAGHDTQYTDHWRALLGLPPPLVHARPTSLS